MGFEIITLSPLWFIALCAFLAGGLTWLLYRKHFFENNKLLWLMRLLRFVGLFLIFALLLSPIVKIKFNQEIKPTLLVYLDQSMSISSADTPQLKSKVAEAFNALSSKFNLKMYSFSESVQNFTDTVLNNRKTSISSVFDYTNEIQEGKNIAALVLISDGIQNFGINPLFQRLNKPAPIFTVGLGDTVVYPDAWVSTVESNSTVFFENEFTVEANIRVEGIFSSQIPIELWEDGVKIGRQLWTRTGSKGDFAKLSFLVNPTKVGIKHYEVVIPILQNENNTLNNKKGVWVNVTDTRRKVAIMAHSAHPDVAAISRTFESNLQYEVKKYEAGNLPTANAFDVAICHGFPANDAELKWLRQIVTGKKGVWVIFSEQCNPRLLNGSEFGFDLQTGDGSNLTQANLNADFAEFLVDGDLATQVKNWPPLLSHFGRYRVGNGFKSLLFQKIGNVNTQMPLWGFAQLNGGRQAWLFGEGLWKWRLKDYEINKNQKLFDHLVLNTIQYLSLNEAKMQFTTFVENPDVDATESVQIIAEFVNENMELDNRADCEISIDSKNGFHKTAKFAKNLKRYKLDMGQLGIGDYTYSAIHKGGKNETSGGRFTVANRPIEMENTVANHALLRNIAKANNGKFFSFVNLKKLVDELKNKKSNPSLITQAYKVTELIHWKWFFGIIVICFSLEWFLRKREGAY